MGRALAIYMAGFCASISLAAAQKLASPTDDHYFKDGQATLKAREAVKPIKRKAKNVILFVADGMDPTTVTAARIFDGQTRGEEGEENFLSFEKFPHLAMSKTYTTNAQTADSAGTMSAMATGVKTRSGVLSIQSSVARGDCDGALAAPAATIAEYSEAAGLSTGVISTARITHATPGAVYAHSADRNWEADVDVLKGAPCKDIARQLIEFPFGDGLEVALGGGRRNFLPAEADDPEDAGRKGRRKDGRDLTAEWEAKSPAHKFVFDSAGFEALGDDARVLGLFERSHMEYEADRKNDTAGEPSLAELTTKAIAILSKNREGFFLLVEAGRVDHAHHDGNAARALRDTQAYSQAIAAAYDATDNNETLIIVTADHGHTLTFAGYPAKGNNILGLVNTYGGTPTSAPGSAQPARDGKPFTTLSYANGPGSVFMKNRWRTGRPAPTQEEVLALDYVQQALIPAALESHGGQDVSIYATGPQAYLFGGTVEQSYVFHVIERALNLRKRAEN
ncbi:MAG: alkaline phosphatase [Pseudomonadota bacterium]